MGTLKQDRRLPGSVLNAGNFRMRNSRTNPFIVIFVLFTVAVDVSCCLYKSVGREEQFKIGNAMNAFLSFQFKFQVHSVINSFHCRSHSYLRLCYDSL
jgi:hypothetical protein